MCKNCDLVYVSNPPDKLKLAEAYHTANYDSAEEAQDAAKTYSFNINSSPLIVFSLLLFLKINN